MTTSTFPLADIQRALDLLITHGVIGDNCAESELGQWLEENDLTVDDLNNA